MSSIAELSKPSLAEESLLRFFWRRFRKHQMALIGAIITLIIVLMTIFAPLLTGYDLRHPLDGH
jgi:ABC-type antimicrobial peptide transport system permease subunit